MKTFPITQYHNEISAKNGRRDGCISPWSQPTTQTLASIADPTGTLLIDNLLLARIGWFWQEEVGLF